ncbi:MAG: alkylmercury lyase family protein [Acidobacteriota bacterium]
MDELSQSNLHFSILKTIVDCGRAPRILELATAFEVEREVVVGALKALHEDHGVVLHPKSHEVWVAHPFATAPTNFWIQSGRRGWWAPCAWCSLGAAALLDRDLTITTTIGGESEPLTIEVHHGSLSREDVYVHFPTPMVNAWDNVIFTCSTMLMFDSVQRIEDWCERHAVPLGDVQPIGKIWEFSQVWYGNHLSPQWTKWTVDEARVIFRRFGLSGPIWDLPAGGERF